MVYSDPSGEPSVDCAQLEKYLKGGLWRMADIETRKLLYLACGMNPADAQATPPIPQIPCADISAIDKLWVQYSKGRFGFSVQRSIWLPLEKKFYEKTDAWAAFGDRVGWRAKNLFQSRWKQAKEINYALNAPPGHLPHLGDRFGILTLEALLKQLEVCEAMLQSE